MSLNGWIVQSISHVYAVMLINWNPSEYYHSLNSVCWSVYDHLLSGKSEIDISRISLKQAKLRPDTCKDAAIAMDVESLSIYDHMIKEEVR